MGKPSNQLDDRFVLGVRSAVVLLLAVQSAALVGVLTYLTTRSVAEAALAGSVAFGGSMIFFDRIVVTRLRLPPRR